MSRARRDRLRLPDGISGVIVRAVLDDGITVKMRVVVRAEQARRLRVEREQRRIARRKHRQRFAEPSAGAQRAAERAHRRRMCQFTYAVSDGTLQTWQSLTHYAEADTRSVLRIYQR